MLTKYQYPSGKSADLPILGANAWRSGAAGEESWIASAKISAKGAAHPVLTFWYYAYPGTPDGLGVYLSCAGKEIRHLATVEYAKLEGEDGWRKMVLPLDGAGELDYISVRFKGFAGQENANIVIDNILVADMPANDFGVKMSAPVRARRGRPVAIPVTVANNGIADNAPFTLTLSVNGRNAAEITGTFASGEERVYTVDYTPTLADGNTLHLVASVRSEADELADNDTTPEATVEITDSEGLAAVSDLVATVAGDGVHLSWTAPADIAGGAVTESFEHAEPWATSGIGDWATVDADGFRTFGIYDVEWPGKMEPHAFIVFNPSLAVGLTGDADDPGYVDTQSGDGSHTYFVGVRYNRGESPASNVVILSASGISAVAADIAGDADIFTLTGIKVGRGRADLSRLPAGIYLMGGRKIAVTR